jgi:hypothetical protein
MNDPFLFSNYGPGDFRRISQKNWEEDQKRILDKRDLNLISPDNPCQFPTKVYVINLDERKDRWERFRSLNAELFEEFDVQRISGETGKPPQEAIFNSFLKVLKIGFDAGYETIIIMEDDSYLANGAWDKIKKAFLDLPSDWDILIGNHYFFGSIEILTDNLARPLGTASTLNFSIVRNTILEKIEDRISLRYNGILGDFDHFITSEEVKTNNFTIWPMVSREYVSHSDHKGCVKNMEIRIREHAYLFPFIDSNSYYGSLESW